MIASHTLEIGEFLGSEDLTMAAKRALRDRPVVVDEPQVVEITDEEEQRITDSAPIDASSSFPNFLTVDSIHEGSLHFADPSHAALVFILFMLPYLKDANY